MTQTLHEYLQREGTVAIANIDTRRLTRVLRTDGAQNGCILPLAPAAVSRRAHIDADRRGAPRPSMSGLDLAKVVSGDAAVRLARDRVELGSGYGKQAEPRFHVVAYDYGVKRNILRMLASRGCRSPWCRRRRRRPRC